MGVDIGKRNLEEMLDELERVLEVSVTKKYGEGIDNLPKIIEKLL